MAEIGLGVGGEADGEHVERLVLHDHQWPEEGAPGPDEDDDGEVRVVRCSRTGVAILDSDVVTSNDQTGAISILTEDEEEAAA